MAGTAMVFADARFRSPTAVQNTSDVRDENVYSSVVLQHGGSGVQQLFTVASGGTIPRFTGSAATAPAQVHQQAYSDLTTNLAKSGELGSAFGEATIRAIGACLEVAAVNQGASTAASAGQARIFGATQWEVADVLSKVAFEFKIGGKRQIIGALNMFPAYGGVTGAISTTGTAASASIASNGWVGSLRRLKAPILCARNDQIQGTLSSGNGSALSFSNTAADGQPTLLWINLHTSIKGDVR
jgi:hypothetical protein